MSTDLIARLRESAEYKLREAWRRSDGGAELCIESVLAADAADVLTDLQAENQRLRASLRECLAIVDRVSDKRAYRALKTSARAILNSTEGSHDD